MTLLDLKGVHVWYDVMGFPRMHAVRGVDLALSPGERLGLVGESGCGKTTLMLAMVGLLPARASVSGRLAFDGDELLAGGEETFQRVRWSRMAIVFQGAMNALNPVRTVRRQIVEPIALHGGGRDDAEGRARELIDMVRMPSTVLDKYPHQLSGGMRQRAMLAIALAGRPQVLLADEPTTALDVIVQAQILELLMELTTELGMALILVTHDLGVVGAVCDRAMVMYAGKVIEEALVTKLFDEPQHPYTQMLFAATPQLHGATPVRPIPGSPPHLDGDLTGCSFAPRCGQARSECRARPPELRSTALGGRAACHLVDEMPDAPGVTARVLN